MKEDFLALFVDSPGFARVLRAFVFDPSGVFTISQLTQRSGVSTTTAKLEIKELERLGIITSRKIVLSNQRAATNKKQSSKRPSHASEKVWFLNPNFKYVRALMAFVHEVSPAQYDIVLDILKRTGKLAVVIISGVFLGDVSRPVDLLVAADNLSETRFDAAVRKLETMFGREIRYAAFPTSEFRYRLTIQDRLIRDTLDFPHTVLLDKGNLL
jgi:DNA-binding Lrp family transcriptional regulator